MRNINTTAIPRLRVEPDAGDWLMATVATGLAATVTYLFWHGSVLEDGDTLGITESEPFSIQFDRGRLSMEHCEQIDG